MNDFRRLQFAAKVLLHHKAMLVDVAAALPARASSLTATRHPHHEVATALNWLVLAYGLATGRSTQAAVVVMGAAPRAKPPPRPSLSIVLGPALKVAAALFANLRLHRPGFYSPRPRQNRLLQAADGPGRRTLFPIEPSSTFVLLAGRGFVGITGTTHRQPGRRRELIGAIEPVPGVDRVVAAGLTGANRGKDCGTRRSDGSEISAGRQPLAAVPVEGSLIAIPNPLDRLPMPRPSRTCQLQTLGSDHLRRRMLAPPLG